MSDRLGRLEGARTALGVKAPCYAATTANVTLSGYQTIDGTAFTADTENKRVLVKSQDDTTENGIYLQASSAWTRAKDFDGNTDFQRGTLVYVTDGTINGGNIYSVSVTDPCEVGEDAIAFVAEVFNTGDVVGPVSSTVGNLAGWDDTAGGTLQDLGTPTAVMAGARYSESEIASAATTNIGTMSANWAVITGNETITSLGSSVGRFRLVYFDDPMVLTHNAAIILPGAANITTAPGDIALFGSNTSGTWFCLAYLRAAGRPLNSGTSDTLAVGFKSTSYSLGTLSSGTTVLDAANSNHQHFTNGGAFTLSPPTATCSMVVEQTNNASAGAITISGFTYSSGDAATTTNGHKFLLFITKSQTYSLLQRKALQ